MTSRLDEIDAIAQAAWGRPPSRDAGSPSGSAVCWLILAIVVAPLLAWWVVS